MEREKCLETELELDLELEPDKEYPLEQIGGKQQSARALSWIKSECTELRKSNRRFFYATIASFSVFGLYYFCMTSSTTDLICLIPGASIILGSLLFFDIKRDRTVLLEFIDHDIGPVGAGGALASVLTIIVLWVLATLSTAWMNEGSRVIVRTLLAFPAGIFFLCAVGCWFYKYKSRIRGVRTNCEPGKETDY